MSTVVKTNSEAPKLTPREELIRAGKEIAFGMGCLLLAMGIFALLALIFFSSQYALLQVKVIGSFIAIFATVQILRIGSIVIKMLYNNNSVTNEKKGE